MKKFLPEYFTFSTIFGVEREECSAWGLRPSTDLEFLSSILQQEPLSIPLAASQHPRAPHSLPFPQVPPKAQPTPPSSVPSLGPLSPHPHKGQWVTDGAQQLSCSDTFWGCCAYSDEASCKRPGSQTLSYRGPCALHRALRGTGSIKAGITAELHKRTGKFFPLPQRSPQTSPRWGETRHRNVLPSHNHFHWIKNVPCLHGLLRDPLGRLPSLPSPRRKAASLRGRRFGAAQAASIRSPLLLLAVLFHCIEHFSHAHAEIIRIRSAF